METKIEDPPAVVKFKSISLVLELHDLERELDALRILLSSTAQNAPETKEILDATWAGAALVCLIRQRIQFLRRAVSGDIDPALIWSEKNEPGEIVGAKDIILRQWTPEQIAERARQDLDRATREIETR